MLTSSSTEHQNILYMPISPRRVKWSNLIHDLIVRGYGPTKIAYLLGKTQSTVQRWQEGAEPNFTHGHAIILLHQQVCGYRLTEKRFKDF